jgi:hypothetical protein
VVANNFFLDDTAPAAGAVATRAHGGFPGFSSVVSVPGVPAGVPLTVLA